MAEVFPKTVNKARTSNILVEFPLGRQVMATPVDFRSKYICHLEHGVGALCRLVGAFVEVREYAQKIYLGGYNVFAVAHFLIAFLLDLMFLDGDISGLSVKINRVFVDLFEVVPDLFPVDERFQEALFIVQFVQVRQEREENVEPPLFTHDFLDDWH